MDILVYVSCEGEYGITTYKDYKKNHHKRCPHCGDLCMYKMSRTINFKSNVSDVVDLFISTLCRTLDLDMIYLYDVFKKDLLCFVEFKKLLDEQEVKSGIISGLKGLLKVFNDDLKNKNYLCVTRVADSVIDKTLDGIIMNDSISQGDDNTYLSLCSILENVFKYDYSIDEVTMDNYFYNIDESKK